MKRKSFTGWMMIYRLKEKFIEKYFLKILPVYVLVSDKIPRLFLHPGYFEKSSFKYRTVEQSGSSVAS